jgi:hypothetical protein
MGRGHHTRGCCGRRVHAVVGLRLLAGPRARSMPRSASAVQWPVLVGRGRSRCCMRTMLAWMVAGPSRGCGCYCHSMWHSPTLCSPTASRHSGRQFGKLLASGLEHRRGVWVHVARSPQSFPASTNCATGFAVSPFCSLTTSMTSLGCRVIGTGAPPWRVVH